MRIRKSQRGFTIIELLVVIAIVGILSSIVLTTLNASRSKGRDAKRISDLTQIRNAIELFYDTYGTYPRTSCPGSWDAHWQCLATCLETGGLAACGVATPNFVSSMSKVPQDPLDNPSVLSDADPGYYYGYPAGCTTGESYRIGTLLENASSTSLRGDIDGSFYNNNSGCQDSINGFCLGRGSCTGW